MIVRTRMTHWHMLGISKPFPATSVMVLSPIFHEDLWNRLSAKNETTIRTMKSHFRFGRQCSSRSFRLCSAGIQSARKYIASQPFVKSFLGHVSLLQGNHTLHLVFSRFARFTGVSFCVTSALSASFVHVVFLEDNIDQYRPLGCFLSKNIDQYHP